MKEPLTKLYLESKEMVQVGVSKHKFGSHISIIKKMGNLVTKSLESLETNCCA